MTKPDEFLHQLINSLDKSTVKVTRASKNKACEFLDFAEVDLAACRSEYDAGRYSTGIFHLQQACEKTYKALLLLVGLSAQADLLEYGHSSKKMKTMVLTRSDPMAQLLRSFQSGMGDEALGREEPAITEPAFADKETILRYITFYEDYARSLSRDVELTLRRARRIASKRREADEAFKRMRTLIEAMPIFSISVFTSPYAATSRYPGKLSLQDYTMSLGIVNLTPQLMLRIAVAISAIRKQYCNASQEL